MPPVKAPISAEQKALSVMVPPSQVREGKQKTSKGGVMQIWITRSCDKSCFGCTQGSNLAGKPMMMTPEQFDLACRSLKMTSKEPEYFGTIGVFGGNPATHPRFPEICEVLRSHFPKDKCGLWCNNPLNHGKIMRETFNPARSNLNVHLDSVAYDRFRRDWPESRPFGLENDSRHSPWSVALKDMIDLQITCPQCKGENTGESVCKNCNGTGRVYNEDAGWKLISGCDINKQWSAMIGVFRNELRGWFCEIAGAQSMLHQHDLNYPDTGIPIVYANGRVNTNWWRMPMTSYAHQVRKHCHECGIPLRGKGELACADDTHGIEQTSKTHADIYNPKRPAREVQIVELQSQLGSPMNNVVRYLQNAKEFK